VLLPLLLEVFLSFSFFVCFRVNRDSLRSTTLVGDWVEWLSCSDVVSYYYNCCFSLLKRVSLHPGVKKRRKEKKKEPNCKVSYQGFIPRFHTKNVDFQNGFISLVRFPVVGRILKESIFEKNIDLTRLTTFFPRRRFES